MRSPSLEDFTRTYTDNQALLLSLRIVADLDTPISLYQKLAHNEKNSFILESVTGGEMRARYSIMGIRPDTIFKIENGQAQINRHALFSDHFEDLSAKPLEALTHLIEESAIQNYEQDLPTPAAGLFGFLAYDMIREIEPIGNTPKPDPIKTPDCVFIRPTIILVVDNVKHEVMLVTPVRPHSDIDARAAYAAACQRLDEAYARIQTSRTDTKTLTEITPHKMTQTRKANMRKEDFLGKVAQAKEYLQAGDIFQVVLSQRFTLDFTHQPFALYRALRRTNPSPYMFFFDFQSYQIIGASPEILVKKSGSEITIRPIAGTRPRDKTPEKDRQNERDLLSDPKERAEHLMLLDLGRNDIGRISKLGHVRVSESFAVERYSHVMHIVSNVTGELSEEKTALDALLSGMPAGTLSGAPKVRAMQIIEELEPEKRGIYGGGVGYFASNGDMDMCIALRTAICKDGKLFIQAGAGIVHDSNPESEFEETIHKSNALFDAARDAHIFENIPS